MNRIAVISMVKNEADIIESFVRHAMTFADVVIIADHDSSDETLKILHELQAEELSLYVREVHRSGHIQEEVMNTLLGEAVEEFHADIIVPLDADEFPVNTDTQESCRDVFENLDVNGFYPLRWRRYEPLSESDKDKFLPVRACRRARADEDVIKVAVGAGVVRQRPFHLAQGQHFGSWENGNEWVPVPLSETPAVHIAHFHWRSTERYAAKIAVGWLNNVVKYSIDTSVAEEWKRAFDRLVRGESFDEEGRMRAEEAEIFDLSPYIEEQNLRYPPQQSISVLQSVLMAGERIAQSYAETKMLAHRRMVSIVIPFLGDEKAWLDSLQKASSQEYPYKEILIPVTEGISPDAAKVIAGKADAGIEMHIVVPETGETMAEALTRMAQGSYVQILLPGNEVSADRLMRGIASLETQPALAWEFADMHSVTEQQGVSFSLQAGEAFRMVNGMALWHELLRLGQYLAGGIAAAVFRRGFVESRGWLMECFLQQRPLQLTMWRAVLKPMAGQPAPTIGVLPEKGFCMETADAEDWLWQQIEWGCLLAEEKGQLEPDLYDAAARRLLDNKEHVPGGRENVSEFLWQQYEEILSEYR